MIIRQNIAALNISNQHELTNKKMKKSLEKLSGGSRINRAADNAAGLAISEKFRQQIRGLRQAGYNAEDGIKFINVADGTMNEVSGILHRMKELSVASLNDTYSETDRLIMETEFNELQSEIDQNFKSSEYNGMNVFEQHESTYFSIKGNRAWDYTQEHKITSVNNNFMISIPSEVEGEADKDYEIKLPLGTYTTQELVDEIETAFGNLRPSMPGFMFEYTKEGFCNFNYEGGEMVKSVSGGLSYLIYDNYSGGKFGNLLGTTEFTADFPLTVSSQNNQLQFYLGSGKNEEKVEITIPPGKYTREQMIDHLNKALREEGITDVTAKDYKDRCIEIGGARIVTGLKGNMFELDDGTGFKYTSVFYDNVKHGNVSTTQGTFNGKAYFTRNDKDPYYGIDINETNNSLKIKLDGKDPFVVISLPEEKYTVAEMIAELNQQFKDKGISATASLKSNWIYPQYFDSISINSNLSGKTSKVEIDTNSTSYDTLFKETFYRDEKIAPITDGQYQNDPPTLAGTKNIPTPIVIAPDKNTLNLTIAGTSYPLTLIDASYGKLDDLITEINDQINKHPGIKDKIIAKASGNTIIFTTITPEGDSINSINFAADPNQGTAYKDLFTSTTETVKSINQNVYGTGSSPPKINFGFEMKDSNEIKTGVNDTFIVTINNETVNISLDPGKWTPDELAKMISKQLEDNYSPRYTFEGKGNEEYKEGQTGPTKYEPAKAINRYDLNAVSKIDSSNNTFKLNVNGENKEITLSDGTYTKTTLVNEINKKFKAAGIGVSASLTGNKLTFTTEKMGKEASLKIDPSNCGSARDIITGINGVSASIEGGKLVLTGKHAASDERIYVSNYYANAGTSIGLFVGTSPVLSPARSTSRYKIERQAYIDGASLAAPICIDSKNKKLEFKYTKDSTAYNFSFDLDEKNYTHKELEKALQEEINKALTDAGGTADDPFVTVDASGVVIKAKDPGAQYKLSDFGGGFHQFTISGTKDIHSTGSPSISDGTQTMTSTFIVGRKDVNNNSVKIETGKNDILILEFTRPDPTTPGKSEIIELEITLDAGTYQGSGLVNEIQKHLKETLKDKGLDENIISVNIGGVSTGVAGANDANALNFQLSNTVDLSAGKYTIDGVRGAGAFYLFYLTEGEPIPAYTTGTANLGDEIIIPADRNEFSFVVDGKKYDYTFPEKTYKTQEFMDMFNDLIEKGDNNGQFPPVKVELKDGHLNIFADDIGKHTIEKIDGSAKGLIFFTEEGRINEDLSFKLQIGANEGNTLDIGKITINTAFMKINTILISKPKYAEKALNRLEYALDYLNKNRGDYGAKSNRLEHIVKNNANTAENLQAAESQLRDTDMARETMENIKLTILSQSTQTMLAQAQKIPKGILTLLS